MKTIYFIRHAKSSWADPSLRDINRPLNKRGLRDGPAMSKKLHSIITEVDLVISSPAVRARQTSAFFTEEIKAAYEVVIDEVYHAWMETLFEVVRGIHDDIRTALIFGHNPGFTSVYNHFANHSLDNLPTCGIFELKINGSWSEMNTKNTITGILLYPKLFL